jgi:hypothetical protein
MTDANKQAPKDKFQQEFEALPLEEKIKRLLKFEAVTLTEAFNYGVNESMKAADRLGDVLSDFGKKVEAEFKKATHHGEGTCPPPKAQAAKPKGGGPKKSPPRAAKG